MYTFSLSLFLLLFTTTNVFCSSFANKEVLSDDDTPFWINPCGYSLKNSDVKSDIINRILILANICQSNIDAFKFDYIENTFNIHYTTHYQRWVNMGNSWMTPRLLQNAEDNFSVSWLADRKFPVELTISFQILQRVAVGFEILLQDAVNSSNLEYAFLDNFNACKEDLQQLLCEISDNIYVTSQDKPADVTRDCVPLGVRQESSSGNRNLTNSIIFRDYMIAVKYITSTYDYLNNNDLYNKFNAKYWRLYPNNQ